METEKKTKEPLSESDLAQFTGTEHWYKHWLGKVVFTDGVKYLAERAGNGCFWLLDEIAISQSRPKIRAEEFQVWILKVDLEKRSAVLTCDDGNENVVFTKAIEFTDFPMPEMKLYFTDNTILLPSEY